MENIELRIAGMTCGSCVASVTKTLKRVSGVDEVHVDLHSGVARVTGENAAQQVQALLASVRNARFDASPSSTATPEHPVRPAACHSPASDGGGRKHGGGCCCH